MKETESMGEKQGNLAVIEPGAQPPAEVMTPMQLLMKATERGADVGTLERLMDLQLRWQDAEAKRAYVEAKTRFYAEAPTITKNKHVGFTSKRTNDDTSYWHATLDHIVETAAPILAKHGLTHHWVTTQDEKGIEVACILTHALGHSERVSLKGPPEMSGTKNPIQGIGSTVTFLERYTFMAVTGLAAKNQDDDAKLTGGNYITIDQALELEALAKTLSAAIKGDDADANYAKVKDRFFQAMKVDQFFNVPAARFDEAKKLLSQPPKDRAK